jgi:hypothetical protein
MSALRPLIPRKHYSLLFKIPALGDDLRLAIYVNMPSQAVGSSRNFCSRAARCSCRESAARRRRVQRAARAGRPPKIVAPSAVRDERCRAGPIRDETGEGVSQLR